MSKYAVPVIAGFVVAFIVAFLWGWLRSATGAHGLMSPVFVGGFFGAFTAYIMANLAGNRKVATASADAKAQALTLTPPPGKALICLYREGFVGKAAGLNVAVDGKVVAQLKSPRFTVVAVAPGSHRISAAFGGLAGAQNAQSDAEVTLTEGQAAAFKFGISMGMLKNTVTATRVDDLQSARRSLSAMSMTVPDLAEV